MSSLPAPHVDHRHPAAGPCAGAAERAQAWLDGALAPKDRAAHAAHLASCAACARVAAAERRFREFLARRAPREAAPAALHARVRAALRRAAECRPRGARLVLHP